MHLKCFVVAAALELAASATPHSDAPNACYGDMPTAIAADSPDTCAVQNETNQTATSSGGTDTIWYDAIYDEKDGSLSNVACSTGEYGLLTRGYNTFGDLPTFPFLGGTPQIQSWNSPYCGSCWVLTYTDASGVPTSLTFTAINTGAQPEGGFSISLEGMNRLTNGYALTLDGVSITAAQQPASACGISSTK